MELRHLRYFVAIADETTFVRAAEKLRVAQPALSRQIKDLEKELDVPLFDRGPRAAALTPGGESCLPAARAILRAAEEAVAGARLAHRGMSGRCILGAGTGILWTRHISDIVERLRADFPAIDLQIIAISHRRQWEALRDCTIDIGIGGAPAAEYVDLASETMMHSAYDGVLLALTHPLANRTSLHLEELRDVPMLRLEDSVWQEDLLRMRTEFSRRGFVPSEERQLQNPEGILAQVSAGQGYALFPRALPSMPGCVVVPLVEFEMPMRLTRIWRRSDERPIVQTLLRLTRRLHEAVPENATPEDPDPLHVGALSLRLELRHLRYFLAVLREGSVGRAAESLGLTQPALSRQMKDLEDIVGVPLLTRDPRGVTATPPGESLQAGASDVVQLVDVLQAAARRGERAMRRTCIVATVPTPMVRDVLARTVRTLAVADPTLNVDVIDIPTPQQADAIRAGEVDIGLAHALPGLQASDATLVRERIADDGFDTAVLPASHPLAGRRAVELQDLADTPFLFMPRTFNPPLYDYVMASFAAAGFTPRINAEYEGLLTVWSLVANGLGWCLGMQSQLHEAPRDTVVVPIANLRIPWGVDVLSRVDEKRAPVLTVREALRHAASRNTSPAYSPPSPMERATR